MEALLKYCSGIVLSLLAILAPIQPLVVSVFIFIMIDFFTGVFASYKVAKRSGNEWFFSSEEAWRTLYKLGFTLLVVVMAWLLEGLLQPLFEIPLSRLFTGFVCGVELWSLLENASQLSDEPYFEWMRRYLRRRVEKEVDRVE